MSLSYGFCLDELSSQYNSAQFSEAFRAVTGDGITPRGARLEISINGFTVTVNSGYALVAGRWLSNDEPLAMTVKSSGDHEDRTDALAVRVDYKARKAALEILEDIETEELPGMLRNKREYSIVLCLIQVRRGATTLTPEDITDVRADPNLCGAVLPFSAIAGDVLRVYQFLHSGIDAEVDRILQLLQDLLDRAGEEIRKLDDAIQQAGGGPEVGELRTVRRPLPLGWLLCEGEPIPTQYLELNALLDGTLPKLSQVEDRYCTYIYAGNKV